MIHASDLTFSGEHVTTQSIEQLINDDEKFEQIEMTMNRFTLQTSNALINPTPTHCPLNSVKGQVRVGHKFEWHDTLLLEQRQRSAGLIGFLKLLNAMLGDCVLRRTDNETKCVRATWGVCNLQLNKRNPRSACTKAPTTTPLQPSQPTDSTPAT